MSDLLQLRDSRGDLLFAGVNFLQNRLVLPDELDAAKLRDLIRVVVTVEGCSLFWFGDLLAWIKRNRGLEFAEEVAEQSENRERLLDAMIVAESFKTRANLSYHHHRECLVECGRNPDLALEWLKEAEAGGWSVAEMRREIRQSHRDGTATANSQTGKPSVCLTSDLVRLKFKMKAILKGKPIHQWSLDEICALRADLEPIARLIGDVERQWQELSVLNFDE